MNPHRKAAAERLCGVINETLGWRGANPAWCREHGYTGAIVLSPRAAVGLTCTAILHRLDVPVALLNVPVPRAGLRL